MSGAVRGRRHGVRAGVAAVAVAFAAAVAAPACGGPRNTLNTATSQCFRALPLARNTVSNRGKLVGVRSVLGTTLARQLPEAAPLGKQRLCVVAFRGPYGQDDVPRSDPAGPGTYALVAVDHSGSTVLASFVVNDLPLRFRHLH
jgi:hypothetical protein